MPSILGASLSELLRQGSQFGQGVVRGREQRQQAEQEAARSQQREALEQALLESQIANQQSLTAARDRPKPPTPLTGRQVSDRLRESMFGQPEGAPDQDVLDRFLDLNRNIAGSTAVGALAEFRGDEASEARRQAAEGRAAAPDVVDPDEVGDPVGQRTRVSNAVKALQGIREDARKLGATFEPGEIERRVSLALELFGFGSVEELTAAQQAFGGDAPDAGGGQSLYNQAAAELAAQGADPETILAILGPDPG